MEAAFRAVRHCRAVLSPEVEAVALKVAPVRGHIRMRREVVSRAAGGLPEPRIKDRVPRPGDRAGRSLDKGASGSRIRTRRHAVTEAVAEAGTTAAEAARTKPEAAEDLDSSPWERPEPPQRPGPIPETVP